MKNKSLEIVRVDSDGKSAEFNSCDQQSMENHQMDLFDDQCGMHMFFVAISDIGGTQYRKLLDSKNPDVIIETRYFPSYLDCYSSMSEVMKDYNLRGIEYYTSQIDFNGDITEKWTSIGKLVELIESLIKKKYGMKLFLLTRRQSQLTDIYKCIRGHIIDKNAYVEFYENFKRIEI